MIENIVYPQLNPNIFRGARAPESSILLYGPPGNEKTMLAKAVATDCKSVFFNVSVSSIISKWIGQSEQLIRTMFAIAKIQSPSVIFFDDIEFMLKNRSDQQNEASRRLR